MAPVLEVGAVAYAKVMAHAAQHPHAAVDGLLIATTTAAGPVKVTDAVPLRHSKTTLALGLDSALRLVEAYCRASKDGAHIVGVYVAEASASATPRELSPVAVQLANAVRERSGAATFVLAVDNRRVNSQSAPAFVAHRWTSASGNWTKLAEDDAVLSQSEATRSAVSRALAAGKQTALVDVDDSFDDPSLDWRNAPVAAWVQ